MDFISRFHHGISKQDIARLLQVSPQAMEAFNNAYATQVLSEETPDDLFQVNAKQMANSMQGKVELSDEQRKIKDRIVQELLDEVQLYRYRHGNAEIITQKPLPDKTQLVSMQDMQTFPATIRPQLSASLQKRDIGPESYTVILDNLKNAMDKKRPAKQRQMFYHMFRQGLDSLDLDPITYEILGCNKNTMGYWLPKIVAAVDNEGFFRIPDTTIMKVPMNLLQLTRCQYEELTRTTLDIVDEVWFKAFELDTAKDYFVKTGTYSSKYDFRNAHVSGDEIKELGEYLLFIHYQANAMAGPLTGPHPIYGASTTNEWVVREYIPDKENNPTIYKGLPLHTEYRVFVDFDTDEILGLTPYWEPETMKKRFGGEQNADSPHNVHDYIIYSAHEETLMKRYTENKDTVLQHIQNILPEIPLSGQWSIDIMQNGTDFWLIDMALAETSAFYKACVPEKLRRPAEENWIPKLTLDN